MNTLKFRLLTSLFLAFGISGATWSQTVLLNETFETLPVTSFSSGGTPGWWPVTTLAAGGLRSDSSSCINPGDSSVLSMTLPVSTVGFGFVLLEFDHICKVEFYDGGYIEASANNGASWTRLTVAHYLGAGQFGTLGNKFNSTSYGTWLPGNPSPPTNGWWQHEMFDISALAANTGFLKIRFVLKDDNNQNIFDNYGWFIDNIKITAALSELTPPSISLVPPIWQGMKFSLGPFNIQASITDTSGIDTARLVYRVNKGAWDTLGMNPMGSGLFIAAVPPVNDLDTIEYFIMATDASSSHNAGYFPSPGYVTLIASSGLPTPYFTDFETVDPLWIPDGTAGTDWQWGHPNYGLLTGAYSGINAWTTNRDSLYANSSTATLTSPWFNFSGASNLVLSFRQNRNTEHLWDGFHLEYTIDDLNWLKLGGLNDSLGENWYNDTLYATAGMPGWTGNSGGWVKSAYRVSVLDSVPMARFRFVFNSDPYVVFEGVSVDDFSVRSRPLKDVAVKQVLSPLQGCGLGLEEVKVMIRNEGIDTLFSVPVSYHVVGSPVAVAELFADTLLPDSSAIFVFAGKAAMAVSGNDSLFAIKVYTSLVSDSIHENDTLVYTLISGAVPVDPVAIHQVIPYGSSAPLTAISPDTLFWFSQPAAGSVLWIGDTFNTPLLYDTTTYWAEARKGIGTLRFTELTLASTGAGSTNPYPPYIPPSTQWCGIEIANTGTSMVDLSGFTLFMEGYKSLQYSLPSGVELMPGDVIVFTLYAFPLIQPDTAARHYVASNQQIFATSSLGFWLMDPTGGVEDAFAVNSYQFPAGSPVTSQHWSGSIPSLSGKAGVIRTDPSGHTAAAWVQSNLPAPLQSVGAWNPQLPPVTSLGCPGNRVPVTAYTSSWPGVDAGVVSVINPLTGKGLTATEPLKVVLKNFGSQPMQGCLLAFSINGATPVAQTFSGTLLPKDTTHFTFAQTLDLSACNTYAIKVWSDLQGDTVPQNDTLLASVSHLLPDYCTSGAIYTSLADISNVTFGAFSNQSLVSARTYTDFTHIQPDTFIQGIAYPLSVTMQMQSTYNYTFGIRVFADLNGDGTFSPATETLLQGSTTQSVLSVTGNCTIPYGLSTGHVRMRVVAAYNTAPASINPCGTYSYGETEDYTIYIGPPLAFDASAISVGPLTPPLIEGLPLQMVMEVKNVGTDTLHSLGAGYMIDGQAPWLETISTPIGPGETRLHPFSNPPLAPSGVFTLKVFTSFPADGYRVNDTIVKTLLGEKDFTPFYFDNFVHDDLNGWSTELSTLWQLGKPAGNVINSAYSPTRAWVTRLSGNYFNNMQKGLITPELNLSGMQGLSLRFRHWYETEAGVDGGNVKYSTNGGTTWITMGYIGDPLGVNWYNANYAGKYLFSGSSGGWRYASYDLSQFSSLSSVKFKFDFYSNESVVYNGWAIDDFQITVEKAAVDAGITDILLPVLTVPAGQTFTVMVRIKNFGKTTLTSIPVAFTINGGIEITDVWTGNLLPGSTVVYICAPQVVSPGFMEIKAYTKHPGDTYLFNDAASRTVGHIGITDASSENASFHLFPNPSAGNFQVSAMLKEPQTVQITIADATGKMIWENDFGGQSGTNIWHIETAGFPAGLYLVAITTKQEYYRKIFIIR